MCCCAHTLRVHQVLPSTIPRLFALLPASDEALELNPSGGVNIGASDFVYGALHSQRLPLGGPGAPMDVSLSATCGLMGLPCVLWPDGTALCLVA